jgi:hypothetical protein
MGRTACTEKGGQWYVLRHNEKEEKQAVVALENNNATVILCDTHTPA